MYDLRTGGESFHPNPRKMKTTHSLISESELLIGKIPSILADLDNCINEYNFCIKRKLILVAKLQNIASALEN